MIDSFVPEIIIYEWDLRLASGNRCVAAELLRRAMDRDRAVLVIAVSTANEPEGFVERERVDAYFTKPLRLPDFERAIAIIGLRIDE